ncbi:MAG: hypothetical protein ACLFR0_05460 [Alphaproteobacteria bacterium]
MDPFAIRYMALLTLFWSVLALLVILWMIERRYYYKRKIENAAPVNLSRKLLSSMESRREYDEGMKASRAFHPLNLYILIAGALYFGSQYWLSYHAPPAGALYSLHIRLDDFFAAEKMDYRSNIVFKHYVEAAHHMTTLLCLFFIYWLAQALAYGRNMGLILFWPTLAMFAITLVYLCSALDLALLPVLPDDFFTGLQWGNISVLQSLGVVPAERQSFFQLRLLAVGGTVAVLFYLPPLLASAALIQNLFSKSIEWPLPAIALGVLASLLFCDLFMAADSRQIALWAAGWGLIGVASIKERSDRRRIYRLHQ